MKNKLFKITWGEGMTQVCSSKTEALKIAAELLSQYTNVIIQKI
jgi:hypothetical protein